MQAEEGDEGGEGGAGRPARGRRELRDCYANEMIIKMVKLFWLRNDMPGKYGGCDVINYVNELKLKRTQVDI